MAETETEVVETTGDSGMSVASTDFPKVAPLDANEDPAKENFLPDPADRETEDQEPQ